MQTIGFRRHLRPVVISGEAVYLFSENGLTALAGPHIEALAPLLDGTRDLPGVLRDLPADIPADRAGCIVDQLTAAGLVTNRSRPEEESDERALAYWDAAGLESAAAASALASARLDLITVGDLDSETMAGALRSAGLHVNTHVNVNHHVDQHGGVPDGESRGRGSTDLTVVLCTDYLDPRLGDIDAEHRATGRPWLLAKPVGATVWIGPFFQPPASACWHCLAVRLMSHRQPEHYVQRALGRSGPAPRSAATVAPLTSMALHTVALEASKWIAGLRHPGQRSVWTLDSFDLRGRHHELRARPQCAACGDPGMVSATAHQPVTLHSRPKASYEAGGHRAHAPQDTLDRYRHLVSPVTGVIKEIGRDARGPAFFNSFRSGPTVYHGARSLNGLKSALRVENGGKGVTALDAEVSAMCEAIERHSATFRGDEARISGSLAGLGDRAIHPNACMLYDERQYADRERWNAAHAPFQFVCAPFDQHATFDWTPVWSMTQQRHRLLPTGLLYFGSPMGNGPLQVRADSNGNAAGSSMEDAVLQGLLELVERDAVAVWWYNRTPRPAVDLDAFRDPWIDNLRQVYADLGRDVWVLDVTSDLGVPTMAALSRQTKGQDRIMFGFGAHLDPAIALRRALTELNQLMPSVLTPNGAAAKRADDPDLAAWLATATVANQPYLAPDPARAALRPGDYAYRPARDLFDDVTTIQRRLESAGMELLVLDQTRPDIGLPVVKVVVPGLRHFWARFAPGRLYDVPTRLGLLAEPTPYEELNPIALFV